MLSAPEPAGLMSSTPRGSVKEEPDEKSDTPCGAPLPQWRRAMAAELENAEEHFGDTLLEEWGACLEHFHEVPQCTSLASVGRPVARWHVSYTKVSPCTRACHMPHLRPQAMGDFFARHVDDWSGVRSTFLVNRPSKSVQLFQLPLWKFALSPTAKVSATCALC